MIYIMLIFIKSESSQIFHCEQLNSIKKLYFQTQYLTEHESCMYFVCSKCKSVNKTWRWDNDIYNHNNPLLKTFLVAIVRSNSAIYRLWITLVLQGGQKTDDNNTIESEGVQKTENSTEQSEQMEQMEETQPSSEQAQS